MSQEPLPGLAAKLFRACLLILGSVLVLNLALSVLRCIWPWLLLVVVIVGGGYVAWQWWRHRQNGW